MNIEFVECTHGSRVKSSRGKDRLVPHRRYRRAANLEDPPSTTKVLRCVLLAFGESTRARSNPSTLNEHVFDVWGFFCAHIRLQGTLGRNRFGEGATFRTKESEVNKLYSDAQQEIRAA